MNAEQKNDKPLRILHVVGGLDRGGIETFLMHVLKRRDKARLPMDFICHQAEGGAYAEEIAATGSRIFRCPFTSQPQKYAREFSRIVKENGPFDVVHSHVHHFDGYVLKLAHKAGVPIRISHSHNDTSHFDNQAGFARRIYLSQMLRFIQKHATRGLACSRMAATSLFGENWEKDARWKMLPYGIDLSPFGDEVDRSAQRKKLGIAEDELFAMHVGRFDPQKNHEFLIRVAKEMIEREPKMRLLLLGKGTLQPGIEKQAQELGINDRLIFGGSRSDVPHCLAAADLFLMPSLHEGFGLACLEAQVSGIPSIVSDTFPPEVNVVPGLVKFLSLNQSASEWAQTALQEARASKPVKPVQALEKVRHSPYNIENCVATLETIYYDAAGNAANS